MRYLNCWALFAVLIFSSCNKDDDKGSKPIDSNESEITSGIFMATVGSEDFNFEENYARYRTTGELAIVAKKENGTALKLIIDDFIGNGIYPFFANSQNSAQYEYSVNGQTIYFTSQESSSGTVEITNYSSEDQELNGTFNVVLTQLGGSAMLNVQGDFSEVPIREIQEPEAGEAVIIVYDEFYNPTQINAEINNLRYFNINIDSDELPTPLSMHRPFNSEIGDGYIDYGGPISWKRVLVTELAMFVYNEESQNLSGKIVDVQRDVEFWFKEISITSFPFEVAPGECALLTETDTIYFDETTYTRVDGATTSLTLEAVNLAGNKIVFHREYDNTNPDFNIYPEEIGVSTYLEYYESQNNNSPSYISQGSFSTGAGSTDDKLSVYFTSAAENAPNYVRIVSNDINYIH